MAIFNSYVKLPEGSWCFLQNCQVVSVSIFLGDAILDVLWNILVTGYTMGFNATLGEKFTRYVIHTHFCIYNGIWWVYMQCMKLRNTVCVLHLEICFCFFLDDHPGLTLFGTVFWVTTGEKSSKTVLEEL